MAENQNVVITGRKKLTGMWFIPLVACLIGVWMAIAHYRTLGPEIYIEFKTADGIEAGKTKIKALSVEIGTVQNIQLKDDLKGVVIKVQLDREAASLLQEDTQFWVVRPRITSAGVSGLGTLLSGAYIELTPGSEEASKPYKTNYIGLDEAPATPLSAPGLHLQLLSARPTSLSVGDPLTFRGYDVGRVEKTKLDTSLKKVVIDCFIKEPFDSLVTSNTRFWNASGISFSATPAGFKIRTGSLVSILQGGVAFDHPEDTNPGKAVDDHAKFDLYPDAESINKVIYKHFAEYLLFFDTSVFGLEVGAPVLYRGIRLGTVMSVSFGRYADVELSMRGEESAPSIPVLIRIEPGRWLDEDTAESLAMFTGNLAKNVADGARASIVLGNFLTGARLVTIDFIDDAKPATMQQVGKYQTIPTIAAGLADLERKISEILNKINQMPLEQVMNNTNVMIEKVTDTVATADKVMLDLRNILGSKDAQQLPNSINTTLNELKVVLEGLSPESNLYHDLNNSIEQLNETLRNIESVTHTMDTKPNSLIFSKPKPQDLQPEVSK